VGRLTRPAREVPDVGGAERSGTDDDQPLVERARRGDALAFERLVQKYQDRAVNCAAAALGGRADAEDVAQEAFVRAYRALGRFRGASTFKTWFYQIVVNTARTHRGRAAARREDREDERDRLDARPSVVDLERDVIARDRLDRALAALPADLREAVVLRDVVGFEYREIAILLAIPMGTVESRIFRARARLRALLTETG
jgi:RNA polymerase sigma-70 factor (ECF subfamily)